MMRKLACLVLILFVGCSQQTRVDKDTPLILISIDTLRSDHLSIYGYQGMQTPAFDAFAKDAIRYQHAFSHTPLTLPSHVSILTGQLPSETGVRDNSGFQMAPDSQTLASFLKEKGYETGAAVSSMVLRKATGIAKGFDSYDDKMDANELDSVRSFAQRRGDATLAVAREWLTSRAQKPFFYFLHLYDPHSPYAAPEPFHSRFQNPYDAEIAYTDSLLAAFFADLKAKGLYDKAMIVLLSDHGEGLGDHGEQEHGLFLYREAIQVPLMIKLPQQRRSGEVVKQNVGLSDLASTLTTALGFGSLKGTKTGKEFSLLETLPDARAIYSESLDAERHYGWFRQSSVIEQDLHFLRSKNEELYDFKQDPKEALNLFGKKAVPAGALELLKAIGEGRSELAQTSAADQELLRSLGYAVSSGSAGMKELSATELVKLQNDFTQAQALVAQGKRDEGEALLRDLLKRNPGFIDVRIQLAAMARERGAFDAVEHLLGAIVADASGDARVLAYLAEANLLLGKRNAAEALAKRALDLDPIFSGRVLLPRFQELGMLPQATAMAERMLQRELDPLAVHAKVMALLVEKKRDEALALVEQGLAVLTPSSPAFLRALLRSSKADVLANMGRFAEAETLLREDLSQEPKNVEARQLLISILLQQGKFGELSALSRAGLALDPKKSQFYQPLFLAALKAKQEAQALQIAAEGLALKNEEVTGPLCFLAMREASRESWEKLAGMILKIWPENPNALFLRGRARHDNKKYQESLAFLRRAADQAEKRGEISLLADAAFFLGDSQASLGDGKAAVEGFQRAIAARPDFAEAQVSMAAIYAFAGRKEDAIKIIDHWLEQFPTPENRQKALALVKRFGLSELTAHYEPKP